MKELRFNKLLWIIQLAAFFIVLTSLLSGNLDQGYFESPNQMSWSIIMVVSSSLTLMLLNKDMKIRSRIILLLFLIISLVVSLWTSKRIVWVAIPFSLIIYWLLEKQKIWLFRAFFIVILLTVFFLNIIPTIHYLQSLNNYFFSSKFDYKVERLLIGIQDWFLNGDASKIDSRFLIWDLSIRTVLKESPIVGFGLGPVAIIGGEERWSGSGFSYYKVITPHNAFIDIFLESGILGFGMFVVIMVSGILKIKKLRPIEIRPLILLGVIVLFVAFIDGGFYPGNNIYLYYWIVILIPYYWEDNGNK